MRTSSIAAFAASAFIGAELSAQSPPQASKADDSSIREVLPPLVKAAPQSSWQRTFGVTDAYPTSDWVKEKRTAITSSANWEEGGFCATLAAYLGIAAKDELIAVLKDPKASKEAISCAAKTLLASGDDKAITEVAVIGISSSTPARQRFAILEVFGDAGEPRSVPMAKELLGVAGAALRAAKDEKKVAEAVQFACAILEQLDHVTSRDARDGLFLFARDPNLPLRLRSQAAAVLSARDNLEQRHFDYLHRVCEGKEFDCAPEAAVIIATHLVYKNRASEHGALFNQVLQKHVDSLPASFQLDLVCVALETVGGPESYAMLRRLAADPRFLNSTQALDSLKCSGSGRETEFLLGIAFNDKLPLQTRVRAAAHAVLGEAEQNDFILPQQTFDSYLESVRNPALPGELRSAIANALLNANTLATERGLAVGDRTAAQRELKMLEVLQSCGPLLPREIILSRQVRLGVPDTVESAVAAILNRKVVPDWRAGIFRGLAAVQPERSAALLFDLASQESAGFNYSPFLIAVERTDSTAFVPALERIASRSAPAKAADPYKAVALIAVAAPQLASETLARLAENGAVAFPVRARALLYLAAVDRAAALPLAHKFAESPVWTLREAGDVCLAQCGEADATDRVCRRFNYLTYSPDPNLPVDAIPLAAYARALASSGQLASWKTLDPYLGFNTSNRSTAIKSGIEEALRSAQSREAVLEGVRKFIEQGGRADLAEYPAALARSEKFGIYHPLRYSPQSLIRIVAARENPAAITGPVTVVFTSRGDPNGALYHSANIIQQLHDKGAATVLVYELGNDEGVETAQMEAGQIQADGAARRPVDNVIFLMHGAKMRAALEGGDPRSGVILDPSKEIDTADMLKFGLRRNFVRPGGLMLLIECSGAEPGDEKHPHNMMKAARQAIPHLRPEGVIASEVPIKFKNVRLSFGSQGELLGMDSGGRTLRD